MTVSDVKSATGCRTCLVRKKKCDEATPVCGACFRLKITCIQRSHTGTDNPSLTNLKTRRQQISLPVSNGYPPFRSALDKVLTLQSPTVFHPKLSKLSRGFRNLGLFASLGTESVLVRDAIVSYSGYGQHGQFRCAYLVSYQRCIERLRQLPISKGLLDPITTDNVIAAILFLGLLEGLRLGNPANCLAHLEVCRRLLTAQLCRSTPESGQHLRLYRIVAEAIIYSFATFSPYHPNVGQVTKRWDARIERLFLNDNGSSPFLGGVPSLQIYASMYEMNVLSRELPLSCERCAIDDQRFYRIQRLWDELNELEQGIYSQQIFDSAQSEDVGPVKYYQAMHRLTVHALKIHLTKISRSSAVPTDEDISLSFGNAMDVIGDQDFLPPSRAILAWPLTILACAAHRNEDFETVLDLARDIERAIDPAPSQRLRRAFNVVSHFRRSPGQRPPAQFQDFFSDTLASPLDLLLEPQALLRPVDENRFDRKS